MTPELKAACEVVFQEHKSSGDPITWNKDAFRGRIAFGLAAMAKQTLERKNIICVSNPAKKTMTVLNPAVTGAASFEEAEEMIQNKVPSVAGNIADDRPAYSTHPVSNFVSISADYTEPVATRGKIKWYLKSWLYYFVWPVCALIAGVVIAWVLSSL
jgi:hypothetical protein